MVVQLANGVEEIGLDHRDRTNMADVTLRVNGSEKKVSVSPETPLLWVLRDTLELTGTKFGCGAGLCGACTVHVEGAAVRSCSTPVSQVAGKTVMTIEGLGANGLDPLQQAWIAEEVPQCGYCQVGQIMAAAALLANTPNPTDDQTPQAINTTTRPSRTTPPLPPPTHP